MADIGPQVDAAMAALKTDLETNYNIVFPDDILYYLAIHVDIVVVLRDIIHAISVCDEREGQKQIEIILHKAIAKDFYQALIISVDSEALSLQELVNMNEYVKQLLEGLNGRIIVKYKRAE